MRNLLFNFFQFISKFIPFSLYPLLVKRDLISIFYHAISDNDLEHVRHLYPVVSVSEFMGALDYLERKFTFVSYGQLHDNYHNGTPLPQGALHLSFDDGFKECFSVVRPILLEKGIPCTFFLTIDWLDNKMLYFRHIISLCVEKAQKLDQVHQVQFISRVNFLLNQSFVDVPQFSLWLLALRHNEDWLLDDVCQLLSIDINKYLNEVKPYLTRDQIIQMDSDGFTIGAHGLSHRKLGFIDEDSMEDELVGSCNAIREITGQEIVPFSFPQSAGKVSRSRLAVILQQNPSIGLLFDTKDLRTDRDFMMNRIWAERPLTKERILHPIPLIFKQAYQDAWVDGIVQGFRKK